MHQLIMRLRGAISAPLPLLGLVAAVGPLAMATGSAPEAPQVTPAEVAYHGLPALPEGSPDRGVDGVVATAIELATTLRAVTTDEDGTLCAPDRLDVSWQEPSDAYEHGAHVTPVGPVPGADTTEVNGVVLCEGSEHAYMGFEARWIADDERWDVVAVPDISDDAHDDLVAQPAPEVPAGPRPVPVLAAAGTTDGPIEGYAAYEPQRTCDPSPKVGTRALAGALLRDHPSSRNLGIVRGCGVGGRSEHKEGRAFDWGVNITNATEKAAAESFLTALMATDADGNEHALARRMGVMYVIWDRQIWSSYRPADGWRPYSGASPHRDHVHISLSWAGAEGRTSFWSGTVPPDLPTATPGRSSGASVARTSSGGSGRRAPVAAHSTSTSGEQRRGGGRRAWEAARALWDDGTPPTADELRAALVAHGMSAADADAAVARWLDREDSHDGDAGDQDARRAEEQRRREAWAEREEAEDAARRAREADAARRREEWRRAEEHAEEARREEREEREDEWRERQERDAEQREEWRERREREQRAREEAWRLERERRRAAEQEAWQRRTTTTTAPPRQATTTTSTTVAPATTTTTVAPTTTTTVPPTTTSTTSTTTGG